jgi:hypothetical protein
VINFTLCEAIQRFTPPNSGNTSLSGPTACVLFAECWSRLLKIEEVVCASRGPAPTFHEVPLHVEEPAELLLGQVAQVLFLEQAHLVVEAAQLWRRSMAGGRRRAPGTPRGARSPPTPWTTK